MTEGEATQEPSRGSCSAAAAYEIDEAFIFLFRGLIIAFSIASPARS